VPCRRFASVHAAMCTYEHVSTTAPDPLKSEVSFNKYCCYLCSHNMKPLHTMQVSANAVVRATGDDFDRLGIHMAASQETTVQSTSAIDCALVLLECVYYGSLQLAPLRPSSCLQLDYSGDCYQPLHPFNTHTTPVQMGATNVRKWGAAYNITYFRKWNVIIRCKYVPCVHWTLREVTLGYSAMYETWHKTGATAASCHLQHQSNLISSLIIHTYVRTYVHTELARYERNHAIDMQSGFVTLW